MKIDSAARMRALRLAMDARGIDVALLSVGSDLPYLTGYTAMPLERLTMLVVPASGEATLVVPGLEAPRVEPGDFAIRPWSETEDPVSIVASLAGRPTVAAIGDQTWAVFLVELLSKMTDTTFVPASEVMSELRIIKSAGEVASLRAAADAVDRVLARVPTEIMFAGSTERQLARRITEMVIEEGHESAQFWIVASGSNAASPHHEPGERVIEVGDAVILDFGGTLDGYCSDVSRTLSVGPASGKLREVHSVVLDAQTAGRASAKAGTPCEAVDAAAREVIEGAGYGDFFIHRTGHGIGMDTHEHPYLVAGNERPLEPGMAFSIEPGIYLPGELGVRIEDICVATSAEVDTLNQADRSLIEVD